MNAGVFALLLAGVATAEPVREFPAGLHAVPIQTGTARLIVEGKPQDVPTALPSGWYFTQEGYDRLNTSTLNVRASLREMEARVEALSQPCKALEPIPPVVVQPQQGWSTKALVVTALALGIVGFGFGVLVR